MFQPLLDAFIESASIKKKLPLNLPSKPLLTTSQNKIHRKKTLIQISTSTLQIPKPPNKRNKKTYNNQHN